MTKAQAEAVFREHFLPNLKATERGGSGRVDAPMRREAWGIYTDSLCKDGSITSRQYNNWLYPRWLLSAAL
jgi:hypothetical protein